MDRLAASLSRSRCRWRKLSRKLYEELNRETKYFDALVRLFDLYLGAGQLKEACESLDRLVDIDPYDYRNQERIAKLEGKADPGFLQNILARAAKAATVSTRTDGFTGAGSRPSAATRRAVSEEARAQQALEDLIVQVEIFLQYSLQTQGRRATANASRNFSPAKKKRTSACARSTSARTGGRRARPQARAQSRRCATARAVAPAPPPAAGAAIVGIGTAPRRAETHRDLAAIAEINRLMYRQSTPREVLATTAAEIGKHLRRHALPGGGGWFGRSAQADGRICRAGNCAAGARTTFQRSSRWFPSSRPMRSAESNCSVSEPAGAARTRAWNRRWA